MEAKHPQTILTKLVKLLFICLVVFLLYELVLKGRGFPGWVVVPSVFTVGVVLIWIARIWVFPTGVSLIALNALIGADQYYEKTSGDDPPLVQKFVILGLVVIPLLILEWVIERRRAVRVTRP